MRVRLQTYLTEPEINDLLRQPNRLTLMGKRDFAIMLLMLRTGLRRDEVCKLKRGDLRVEGRRVWLYVIGKGDKERKIPIKDRELLGALMSYWKKAEIHNVPTAPFFKTLGWRGPDKGKEISWRVIQYIIGKYVKLAKIKKNIHPHSLRHSFITHTLRKSGDIVAVQALAGHSNITSTQKYLHTEDELMIKAIEKLTGES